MAIAMGDETEEPYVVAVVLGFTATVLFLAHVAGTMLRDRKAGLTWVRGFVAWICLVVWFGLGCTAFYVRLTAENDTGPVIRTDDAPAAADVPGLHVTPTAVMLAALYLGTGLVAAVGAYLSHNRAYAAFRQARRKQARAAGQAATGALAFELATGNRRLQETLRAAADGTFAEERYRRWAMAEELKQYARVVIAQRAADPALTDALFEPDRNPFQPPPSRPSLP
ncbi:hypothetical protein Dvina_04265 [Dactylosporangium vinaceum]|uniref:Integral membrane protein n=1 Tax=Dactylosporangium vinaceum TaxID=53362 RepID=A0ABV5M0P1_9ACTN|nr:hypothetical protein [Dactylosporangium vinaceum]UAB97400.1 hypothetical protein Dvina_04265 [Dactylosporangium vinaceum]